MRFPAPLIPATLVKRYKRFLADVVLDTGEALTVHVAILDAKVVPDVVGEWLPEAFGH